METNFETNQNGINTYAEILSQPEIWDSAIIVAESQRQKLEEIDLTQFDQVIFTGCGSTYYLSLSAAFTLQQTTGIPARAVPASELLFSPDALLTSGKTLLVALSRSGSTTETVAAVNKFKNNDKGYVIAISNYPEEALAGLADIALIIEAGQEQSVAQTRSFASMLVAATTMTSILGRRNDWIGLLHKLQAVGSRLITEYEPISRSIGQNINLDRFYFLGSGARFGLACETNLKLKEMTLTHSEPFHFFEFRHGPMAMVTPSTQIIGLYSEFNLRNEAQVMKEMKALGAHTLSLGETQADINFNSGIPEVLQNVLFLPILQLMAFHRSIHKGLNPDKPNNLSSVVTLDI
ncbi:MAG: hypothetical protein BGO78_11985 [Chloroflexi bacterium 44-23]|nr:MAG: hypothetical protein BGO78_11985 [Chloroflexi bacterium 44-23]